MISTQEKQVVQASTLFKSLPDNEAEWLMETAHVRDYTNGETLFIQGDRADYVFVVLQGWVKLYRIDEHGQEAVVTVFSEGHSFAEAVALKGEHFPVSAECVSESRLLLIPATGLVERLSRRPDLALSLVASTFQHLHELIGQVESLKVRTGAQRVANFLLDLCAEETGSCVIRLPYEKHLIAGRLGLKPESLSRVFSRLAEHGVAIDRDLAKIESVTALKKLCNQDRAANWK